MLKSAALVQRQVTKIKVAMPKLNLSCSRRKYCAILRILAAISASSAQDASSDSAGQPETASEAAAVSHPRPTSSSEAQQQENPPPDQRGAHQRCQHLSDWRLLDVSVHIAPKSSISLILWDEDSGAEGGHANPVPIAEMSICNVTISYISFADESSTIEAGIGVIQGCVPHLLCCRGNRVFLFDTTCPITCAMRAACDVRPSSANAFRKLISSPQHAVTSPAPASGVRGVTSPNFRVLHLNMRSDGEGSESVLWLGHLQVVIIRDALLSMLAVFQSPPQKAATGQHHNQASSESAGGASNSAGGTTVNGSRLLEESAQDARAPGSGAAAPAEVFEMLLVRQDEENRAPVARTCCVDLAVLCLHRGLKSKVWIVAFVCWVMVMFVSSFQV